MKRTIMLGGEGPEAIVESDMTKRTALKWRERLIELFGPNVSTTNTMWKALFPIIDALGHKAKTSRNPEQEELRSAQAASSAARKSPPQDPVAAASSIVRSVSRHGVDWSREPATERERKIRAKILDDILEFSSAPSFLTINMAYDAGLGLCKLDSWPSDLRTAYETAKEDEDRLHEERCRKEYEAAAREVDGLPPLDDDEDDAE